MKVLCLVILFISLTTHAQRTVDISKNENVTNSMLMVVGGQPFVNVKFTELVSGTPYFNDNFLQGLVLLSQNKSYIKLPIRLNLYDNELQYREGDNIYIATTPAIEVYIKDEQGTDHHFVNSNFLHLTKPLKNKWLEQLFVDSIALYKLYRKDLKETRQYNAAAFEQSIYTYAQYLVQIGDQLEVFDKLKSFATKTGPFQKELEQYYYSLDKDLSNEQKILLTIQKLNQLMKENRH